MDAPPTSAEAAALDKALTGYRLVNQPAEESFENMLKAMKSPFETRPERCAEQRDVVVKCLTAASGQGYDGKHGSVDAMLAHALECRPAVDAYEQCSRALQTEAFHLMRASHSKMLEAQRKQMAGPSLPQQ